MLLFIIAAVSTFIFIISASFEIDQRKEQEEILNSENSSEIIHKDEFLIALEKFADDNTIIISSINCEYNDMALNWILSLERIRVQNYLLIAQDKGVFTFFYTTEFKDHVILPPGRRRENLGIYVEGGEFGSIEFNEITGAKPKFMKAVLNAGYDVIWSDVDMFWQLNPISVIKSTLSNEWWNQGNLNAKLDEVDVVLPMDMDSGPEAQLFLDRLCTCLIYIPQRRMKRAMIMLDQWEESTKDHANQDQLVLWKIGPELNNSGIVRFRMLHPDYFPPGVKTFGEERDLESKLRAQKLALVVHANFVEGRKNKLKTLKQYGYWMHNLTHINCK